MNCSALTPTLSLCSGDAKFVEMYELFRNILPDLELVDFFQPNSKLSLLKPSEVTYLHMHSLLSIHFSRKACSNRRTGVKFGGYTGCSKKSEPGIYFSLVHVTSICELITGQSILGKDVKLIWDHLRQSFQLCLSEESRRFIGDTLFDLKTIVSNPIPIRLGQNVDRIKLRTRVVKKRSLSPDIQCNSFPKIVKLTEPLCIGNSALTVRPYKNYTLTHRSTVIRQNSRIKSLKLQNRLLLTKCTLKENENLVLANDLKNLQAGHLELQEKFQEHVIVQNTVVKANKDLIGKLKSSNENIDYLTNKLLSLEDIQNDLEVIENQIEDPNFDSVIRKANDNFDQHQFPQIEVRHSIKIINPAIHLGIILLRQIGRVSLENTMPLFLALANSVFGQKWDIGNFTPQNRIRQALPPTKNKSEKPAKKPISNFTLPAKSFTRSLEKNVLEPAALKSSAVAIKNCDVGSLSFDHLSIKRGKAITLGVMTGSMDPVSKEKSFKHMTLGVKQVVDTTALGTYRSVIEILRLAAAASADSDSAEDIQKSFKHLLTKLKFQVTDDASQMRPVNEKINELIHLLGIDGSMIFLHCNAHIVPALDTGVTKVLIDVEKFLQISDQMVRPFNQSFHKVSNSTIETMLRAIFKFVGDSAKNDSWAMTNDFQTFLEIVAEDGEKNFFKNPDSSKFGLSQEMCFILLYSFSNVKEFITRVYAGNNMYKACSLYIQCPFFKECLCSITLLFYHVTAPFLVAVGSETQYGHSNLCHSELLRFFPKFVESLQSLTEDPSPYLKPDRLQFLKEFEQLCIISKKKYREMFNSIFEEINSPECDINFEIVKMTLKLLTEEYLIVIDRQAKEFYIGEDSVVAKEFARNPHIIDLVATTSLSAEHSVGITRQDSRRAPTASMATLSIGQTFKSSPLGSDCIKGKIPAQKLGEIMKETRRSGAQKFKKLLTANDALVHKSEKSLHLTHLTELRNKVLKKKLDIIDAVKDHGGPFTSPEEVDKMCSQNSNLDVLKKIVDLELKYQQHVIGHHSVPQTRFNVKRMNKITRKYDNLPVEERIENLKTLVNPIGESTGFNIIDPAIFIEKATAKHNEMKKYPHRSIDSTDHIKLSFDDPFFNNLHSQSFVAVYCIDEDEIWYPAKILSVDQNKNCPDCSPLVIFHGNYPYCFKVQFMAKITDTTYDLEAPQYHVPAAQIIPCIPNIVMKAGKARGSRIKFIINNTQDILLALGKNILHAYNRNQ